MMKLLNTIVGLVLLLVALACTPIQSSNGVAGESTKQSKETMGVSDKVAASNWQTRFTFEGQVRPGPYTVDPHVWVYTKGFAERFGMPKKWISNKLRGVEAAAWRKVKTGYVTCGWGGKRNVCREEDGAVLELYFDTRKINLSWAPWSRESDILALSQWGNSQGFLVSQNCETRRDNSTSPVGDRSEKCKGRISRQPLADPGTREEIFLFAKGVTYSGQGNFYPLAAYDKRSYPNLAWMQTSYTRPVGLFNPPEAAVITFETRTAPLGKTLKKFHEVLLPSDFDQRIKEILDAEREVGRKFYKKSLDVK